MPAHGKTLGEAIEGFLKDEAVDDILKHFDDESRADFDEWRTKLAEHLEERLTREFMPHSYVNAFALVRPTGTLAADIGWSIINKLKQAYSGDDYDKEHAHAIDTLGIRFPAAFVWFNAS